MNQRLKELSVQFTKECVAENKKKAMSILDKIQKKSRNNEELYLYTCKVRIDLCCFKFEKAIKDINMMIYNMDFLIISNDQNV